ncbi:MAG TPA: type II secretion system protein GspG [Terriglobia bacterium]|nr:type II secretion system protein GspG [Terriglobia bacterium]
MRRKLTILLLTSLALSACSSARLSHDEARKKIAEIGRSTLVPDAIEIRRIVSQTDTQAVAEASVTLAFQFKRDKPDSEWQIAAVRLGDRDWISLDELLAAINEGRRKVTAEGLRKLADGIAKYRERNGSIPDVRDIVTLTDILHPAYVDELVREDAWGHPIDYQVSGGTAFKLVSPGPDGRRGTADDIVLDSSQPVAP